MCESASEWWWWFSVRTMTAPRLFSVTSFSLLIFFGITITQR